MGVFAKLLRRSSGKSTESAADAIRTKESGADEGTGARGEEPAPESEGTSPEGACAQAGETSVEETPAGSGAPAVQPPAAKTRDGSGESAPSDTGPPAPAQAVREAGSGNGHEDPEDPEDKADGGADDEAGETSGQRRSGTEPGRPSKEAPAPDASPEAAQGAGTEGDMDSTAATVEAGDGVGIPKQQSAEEAADSESGDNARK